MSKKTTTILSITTLLLVLFFSFSRTSINAAISACSASVTPGTSPPGVSEKFFTFTVSNTDSVDIKWFKITKPLSGVSYISMSLSGWEKTISGDAVIFQYNPTPLSPGQSVSPVINVSIGEIAGSSGNWTVEASDDSGGASPFSCSGSLGLSVSGSAPDTTAPIISGITISSITSSQVTISWTTNENANSSVDYGVEYSGPSNKTDSASVTSHSLTLTDGIGAGTLYYYQVCSSDASGNQGCTDGNSFTTASASSAGTSTTTSTTTTTTATTTAKATPTPKPLKDTVAPTVSLDTDFDKPFAEAPKITGKASDGGAINAGVAKVEYSTDDGKNWLAVDNIKNVGAKSTAFDFTPVIFEDGNYKIKVRSKDSTGNVGYSRSYTLIIDRLPPQVGGSLVSFGPQSLMPDASGYIYSLMGLDQKITLSTVGGPISIDLSSGNERFELTKNSDNGLWSGMINFPKTGTYSLEADSVDGAENKTKKTINTIVVLEPGEITYNNTAVKNATVEVYYLNKSENTFVLWDASQYGQKNPQKTDNDGYYRYFLPPGTYYLQAKASGFRFFRSDIFTLDKSLPINNTVALEKMKGVRIWFLNLPFLDFKLTSGKISLNLPSGLEDNKKNDLTGKEIPGARLMYEDKTIETESLRGKSTVVTFLNTWLPSATEQIKMLQEASKDGTFRVVVVIPQETVSKVSIYKKRGGYDLDIFADPDGVLIEPLNLRSFPTHIFLDRKGVIKKVVTGLLTKGEILANLIN